jgi:hypothetical protein
LLEDGEEFDYDTEIEKAKREYKRGRYLTLEEVLSKEGFVLSKK